jgi:hypothetical protein
VLDHLCVRKAEEVVEGGVDAGEGAFGGGELPGGDAIGEVGVVLGEEVRVDVAGEQVEATADVYVLRETPYETAVFVGAVEVRYDAAENETDFVSSPISGLSSRRCRAGTGASA